MYRWVQVVVFHQGLTPITVQQITQVKGKDGMQDLSIEMAVVEVEVGLDKEVIEIVDKKLT